MSDHVLRPDGVVHVLWHAQYGRRVLEGANLRLAVKAGYPIVARCRCMQPAKLGSGRNRLVDDAPTCLRCIAMEATRARAT